LFLCKWFQGLPWNHLSFIVMIHWQMPNLVIQDKCSSCDNQIYPFSFVDTSDSVLLHPMLLPVGALPLAVNALIYAIPKVLKGRPVSAQGETLWDK
jgi:hypothetical protein